MHPTSRYGKNAKRSGYSLYGVSPLSKNLHGGTEEINENHCQETRYTGEHSNPVPNNQEAVAQSTRSQRSILLFFNYTLITNLMH